MANNFHDSIAALILDMDGVLWRGPSAIGDLPAIFEMISRLGLKVIFATNNATRTIQQYVELLNSFGISAQPSQIVTSGTAVTYLLKRQFPLGGNVYIIGEAGLVEACQAAGFLPFDHEVQAVVAGMDHGVTYEKLKTATLLLRNGVEFIGTNPDHTFPTPEGLVPGAGAILAALTTASDRLPLIAGKPEPIMYEIALERLGLVAKHVLVVGDRPETDMVGAQRIGCHTALVLSGVTDTEQAQSWRPQPDIIADDLAGLVNDFLKK